MLDHIELSGFRSIRKASLDLGKLNVLIGANGAGKSNLIAFFKFLNEMMGNRLQEHVSRTGRASSLLHGGPKTTPQVEFSLRFSDTESQNHYRARLFFASMDTLVFAEETIEFRKLGRDWKSEPLKTRNREETALDKARPTHKVFRYLLSNLRVYHFHDTSETAGMRRFCYLHDRWPLMPQAENLAAFLYSLSQDQPAIYARIVATIRLLAPFFADFDLQPSGNEILLNWRQSGSEQLLGPHQLSDGTLRAMGLVALLLQPEEQLPKMIVVDEPELGLHPYALGVVARLFAKASHHTQVLVSTQSPTFLDHFEPQDIIVVDREQGGSSFQRLPSDELASWLEDYSLGEVWQKNLIGGGPH